jgi:Kef-type K+ transport system membrane component KefB
MDSIVLTFTLIFVGIVLLPPLASRLRIPVIVFELLFGIAIGKSTFNIIGESSIFDFFSTFGLIYLMFLAGMEMDMGEIQWTNLKRVILIALASISVPFICGMALSSWLDINPFLLGTILCTTSLGLVLPTLKDLNLTGEDSQMLLVSVIIVDILSMFILAFVLSAVQGTLEVRFIYSILAILSLFFIPWFMRKKKLGSKITVTFWKKLPFDLELRASFAIIFILGSVSLQLGFHAIIGAFIAGLIISEIFPKGSEQEAKLQSFGYSFFIPLFFIFIGAKVNLIPVFSNLSNLAMLLVIVAVGFLSKTISVTVASRLSGFEMKHSLAFGFFHTARLSLIIAAVDISLKLNLIDNNQFAIFIILAVFSAILAPSLGKYLLTREKTKVQRL